MLRVVGNELSFNGKIYRCAIGKGGFSDTKKEGDGATPLGVFALRECWYRADKLAAPATGLPLRAIQPDDGWCDAVAAPEYNTHVKLPFTPSHEQLFRADSVYDIIVPLGYNDGPIIAGAGSAIFMHVAKPDYSGTEGCVALSLPDLLEVLAQVTPTSCMDVRKS